MDENSFTTTLIHIANQLREVHKKSLIFLVHSTGCSINPDMCKCTLDLFQIIKENKLITPENPSFLKRLLEIIKRRDLADMLPDAAGTLATVSEFTVLVYEAMVDLTVPEVSTLKFYFRAPQGKEMNDGLDIATYLRQKEMLKDISKGLENLGRIDLVKRIARHTDVTKGATAECYNSDHITPDLALLIVGKAGVGKSRTGNTILGRKVFNSSGSMSGGTEDICSAIANVKDRCVKVVDGPGFGDPDSSRKEGIKSFKSSIRKAVDSNKPGYHALLLVLRYQPRLTKEDYDTVKILKKVFGKDFIKKYCVVVITHGDNFKYDAQEEGYYSNIHQWLSDQTGLDIMNDCCRRVVLFDNKTQSESDISAQLNELLGKIFRLNTAENPYTDENLKLSKSARRWYWYGCFKFGR